MKIVIGCDHAAYPIKQSLKLFLLEQKFEVKDLGTDSERRCDYPTYATAVCRKVIADQCRGILLCGTGIGMSMTANRYKEIRAALCRTKEEAQLSREHNDANILCLGARTTAWEDIQEIVMVWLKTQFEGGRHQNRIALFKQLGESI